MAVKVVKRLACSVLFEVKLELLLVGFIDDSNLTAAGLQIVD